MVVKASRSLKASSTGIRRANRAVMVFATKIDLAAELEISRATVQNFFAEKPIGRENFHKICQALKLPWQEIADLTEEIETDPAEFEKQLSDDSNRSDFAFVPLPTPDLVQTLRQQIQVIIQQQCGSLRVLDMSQPRKLSKIYTEVKLLEKMSSRRWLNIPDLLKASVAIEDDRPCLNCIPQKPLPGFDVVEKHSKLMILGKPGAGKTIFLKQIAIECIEGNFLADRVPIFISLKDFAETPCRDFLHYITAQFATISTIAAQLALTVLIQGNALLLLDGLDEVGPGHRQSILQAVRQFVGRFHANQFVITCRIAAQDYLFEQFTEVEIADFDWLQITNFALKWFADRETSLCFRFMQALQQNRPIQELATNPLLLTLLCLVFEDSGEFAASRAALCKESLQVLLKNWDARRHIERSQAHQDLPLRHKEELLSHIALSMLERGDYFFRQKELEQFICDYRRRLPRAIVKPDDHVDSEAVLKAIEAQHGLLVERARGVYSFPHFIFHEYFAAQRIVSAANGPARERFLQRLVNHVTNRHWREVFLLTMEMLPDTACLVQLIEQKLDCLAQDASLQRVFSWLTQKTEAVSTTANAVELRSRYLELELGPLLDLADCVQLSQSDSLEGDLTLDRLLVRIITLARSLDRALEEAPDLFILTLAHALAHALVQALSCSLHVAPELALVLQALQAQLPLLETERAHAPQFREWWQKPRLAWTVQLRSVIVQYRNLGHDWQLTAHQKRLLQGYYRANQLLLDCLNYASVVTPTTLPKSQGMLLLPATKSQR
ncbi:NACHT domain-containing protein [Stenomitos frigidus]|uniref:NTPase (NACHT family) n=1 Tax=Stenomitos frigidus ULC18 TaxID=2107698 RepID=A0A2T1DYH1_9CYAN|nr:NACHT domain-containing NTPase [Stenomitos frigidus]PSB25424.1 NTPase (NACHT family) [Stenomitos frigidus ULC18]